MIYLFVEYFESQNKLRNIEIDYTLTQNIECNSIDKIIVFTQDKGIKFSTDKIKTIYTDSRLTFSDWFEYIQKHPSQFKPEDVLILSNSDIIFDKSIEKTYELRHDQAICLTRREVGVLVQRNRFYRQISYSQDTWVIRGMATITKGLIEKSKFYLGTPGCDNAIAKIFQEEGLSPFNPCIDITAKHFHGSSYRSYLINKTEWVNYPHLYLNPCKMDGTEKIVKSFHNEFHLGDCAMQINFFIKCLRINPNYYFNFYCQSQYHEELKAHIVGFEGSIHIYDINLKNDESINCWINTNGLFDNAIEATNRNINLSEIYKITYEHLYQLMTGGEKEEFTALYSNPNIMTCDLPDGLTEKPIDILFVNSEPKSGQLRNYNEQIYSQIITELSHKYNVVCTQKLNNIYSNALCTADFGLNLIQIGALATQAKYIVGVNTSPMITSINNCCMTNQKVIIFDDNCYLTPLSRNVVHIKDINDLFKHLD